MAKQEGAIDIAGLPGIPRSNSDRPFAARAIRGAGHFMVRKPLGGFGVIVIALVIAAAISANVISRYDPEESFSVDKPTCTETQAAEITVSDTGEITKADNLSVCFDPV